ncbi:MAG: hydrogenase maturation nickel metallochaperone HypA [Thermoproteota archaeon]|nr:MAG: hydrogenase maturation nickel metallochaperone HypA [Candidatus Korarchaeota archaeon]
MHEFSVAQAILDVVLRAAHEHGAKRVLEVTLEVGELSFLSLEQLELSFKVLSEGTIAEGAELKFEVKRASIRCLRCGYEGEASAPEPESHLLPLAVQCPACSSLETVILDGRGCVVRSIRAERS